MSLNTTSSTIVVLENFYETLEVFLNYFTFILPNFVISLSPEEASTMVIIPRLRRSSTTFFTAFRLTLLFCARLTLGQENPQFEPANYSVSHYDDQNGLPQNSVKGLAQGVEGFVWLTTENGLVRFDGSSFYVFDQSNVGVTSNRFRSIQPDMRSPFNRLYARQIEDGYLRRQDQYLRIEREAASLDSTVWDSVFKAIGSGGADRDTYFSAGTPDLASSYLMPENYIIPITRDEGAYFHFRERKLRYYRGWKLAKEIIVDKTNPWEWFRLGKSLYYRTGDYAFKELSFADSSNATDTLIRETNLSGDIQKDPLYQSSSEKTRLYWNNTADQVFLALGRNLYILNKGTNATLNTRLMLTDFDLESNFIGTVLYDKSSRRLFLGSHIKGLFVVKKNEFRVVSSRIGGIEDVFYAQTHMGASSVQTPNGLIFNLQGELSSPEINKIRAARSEMRAYRITVDRYGNIWTAGYNMLYCFASDGFTLKGKWDLVNEISDMHLGHDGTLWIAMAYNLLYRAEYAGDSIGLSLFTNLSLKGKRINFLLHQKDGAIWIGTGMGVYSFNIVDKKLALITGTSAYNVRSLYISPESAGKHLWIASYNNGFALYENGVLTAFPLDRNRYLAASHYLFEDKNGFFWIPTNKGLFQARKSELLAYARKKGAGKAPYYKHFNANDGFKTNEFNGGCRPCAVRLDNGYVSMPSMNGLLFFIPETLSADAGTADIFIDRVESQGKSQPITGDQLTLLQDEKNRNIFVSTPFFGNASNLVLSYALTAKGQDPTSHEWVALDPREGINVSRLGYGAYTLHVRKQAGFGENSIIFKSLELNVLPKWYQTWYFKTFIVLVAVFVVYLIQRMSVRRVQRRNRKLELSIAERTQELQETLHSLRFSEEELTGQLRLHIRMIASLSHDVRTPVHYIRVASEGIENYLETDEIPNAKQLASTIGITSKRLVTLLDSMVAFTKTEMSETPSISQETNLRQLVIEKTELFKPILAAHRGKLLIDIADDLRIVINPNLFAVIIHNLVDNAVKVKDGNTIYVVARAQDGTIYMTVRDNGPGMPAELAKWLTLSLGETTRAKPMPEKYDGLGLMMVREIAQILGIQIFVEVREGTKIQLMFRNEGIPTF